MIMSPNFDDVQRIIAAALAEDIGQGDVTCEAVIDDAAEMRLALVARHSMVLAGLGVALRVFDTVDSSLELLPRCDDGDVIAAGEVLALLSGNARSLLTAERTALNLLQRMCGIASETARYVEAVAHTHCRILDTRKTAPCLRALDKYAVRCGGGHNHRMGLYDSILIKDNHIALVGSVSEAIQRAKANAPQGMSIEVECDTLEQAQEALAAGAERLLLDNMSLEVQREAVLLAKSKASCEASGNMTLERVAAVAETGVDFISIGALTHSVKAADIGLDAAE